MRPEPTRPDDAIALDSSIETVCFVIAKARQYDAKVPPVSPDDASNPVDDIERDVLDDSPADAVAEELAAHLDARNDDEAAELVALAWTGRGDYDRGTWPEALRTARERLERPLSRYLLGMPLLADYLEQGLSELGYSCEDYEVDRL